MCNLELLVGHALAHGLFSYHCERKLLSASLLQVRFIIPSCNFSVFHLIIFFRFFFSSLFRTMGLRHLVVVDGEMHVAGIVTRTDLNEHVLEHLWKEEVRKSPSNSFAYGSSDYVVIYLSFLFSVG